MDTGLPVTPAASLTRNLLRAADFLPSFYAFAALSMLWRHDFKRLGDLAAGTLVVHAPHIGRRARNAAARAGPTACGAALRARAGGDRRLGRARRRGSPRHAPTSSPRSPSRSSRRGRCAATASAALAGVAHWLLGRR